LIDRGASPDVDQAKDIVRQLGIEQYVQWLKGPHPYGFDRAELLPLYSVADVVVDEFGIGWFGSVVIEGLVDGQARSLLSGRDRDDPAVSLASDIVATDDRGNSRRSDATCGEIRRNGNGSGSAGATGQLSFTRSNARANATCSKSSKS
jgi:hypothetical protein